MDSTIVDMMNVNLFAVNFVIGIVLPALVALVTKADASPRLKSLALLLLSAVSAALTAELATTDGFDWQVAALSFIQLFYTAVGAHYGLLKPSGISGTEGVVASKVPGGIG